MTRDELAALEDKLDQLVATIWTLVSEKRRVGEYSADAGGILQLAEGFLVIAEALRDVAHHLQQRGR